MPEPPDSTVAASHSQSPPPPTKIVAMKHAALAVVLALASAARAENPIVRDVNTADPTALVHGDTVYLYVGHDEAPPKHQGYVMKEWLVFTSTDMKTWTNAGVPLKATDFAWAKGDAWACSVIEKAGKFYFYAPVEHDDTHRGKAIGVAVSDSPTGPFKDARGSALITAETTPLGKISWEDIDPCVFLDDDGQAYLFWGNTNCYCAKLRPNMTELDGDPIKIDVPRYTEAPYVHKHNGMYYLSYATLFPEKIAYATSDKIAGPWRPRGLLSEMAGNSNTIHQSIIDFKNQSYFIYHNGALAADNGSFRRSICVDYLYYNADGTIRRVVQTTEGTSAPPEASAATQPATRE